jgi:hypothetical protein
MRRILLILFIIIIAVAGGWYWFAKSHQTAPGVPAITDFSAFFPIGDTGDPSTIDGLLQDTIAGTSTATTIPSAFTQLSPQAVAGFSSFTKPITIITPADPLIPKSKPTTQILNKDFVRYVSRGNGYVYEIEENETPLQISNVYIPNIYETVFGDNFNTALLRFLRDDQRTIATYSVPIPPPNPDGTRTQKEGVYLPENMQQVVTSPDKKQIAYLTTSTSGATISLASLTNTKRVALIQTPFREWLLSWPNTKNLYLQTKPSATVFGYLYRIDTTEKKLRRVLGDINGLTTSVSPSGLYVLYSQHTDGGFITRILNTKSNTTRTLNLTILPEKCVWLQNEDLMCAGNTTVPTGEYPDAWYQGTVSLSDQLYRISTATLTYDTLYDASSKQFDMTNLAVNEITRNVYFVDKPTGILWKFEY